MMMTNDGPQSDSSMNTSGTWGGGGGGAQAAAAPVEGERGLKVQQQGTATAAAPPPTPTPAEPKFGGKLAKRLVGMFKLKVSANDELEGVVASTSPCSPKGSTPTGGRGVGVGAASPAGHALDLSSPMSTTPSPNPGPSSLSSALSPTPTARPGSRRRSLDSNWFQDQAGSPSGSRAHDPPPGRPSGSQIQDSAGPSPPGSTPPAARPRVRTSLDLTPSSYSKSQHTSTCSSPLSPYPCNSASLSVVSSTVSPSSPTPHPGGAAAARPGSSRRASLDASCLPDHGSSSTSGGTSLSSRAAAQADKAAGGGGGGGGLGPSNLGHGTPAVDKLLNRFHVMEARTDAARKGGLATVRDHERVLYSSASLGRSAAHVTSTIPHTHSAGRMAGAP